LCNLNCGKFEVLKISLLFYRIIKILARCSLLFFFRKKIVCGVPLSQLKGPAIIAANHPNSLMDAIVIGCMCKQRVHFTIRSDMFRNRLFKFLLTRLNGIPVYRLSEEKDKMRENFTTIQRCKEILKQKGIIIIFAEGYTLHDWQLKPLKSGISKIVMHAISDSYLKHKLAVVPVGLTYSDYHHPAKTIIIQSGNSIYPGLLPEQTNEGQWKQAFSAVLFQQLELLIPRMASEKKEIIDVWQIILKGLSYCKDCTPILTLQDAANKIQQPDFHPPVPIIQRQFLCKSKRDLFKSVLLFLLLVIPGTAGLLLNTWYYFPVSRWAYAKTKSSIFYDALLCGLLTVTYPIYIITVAAILHYTTSYPFWIWTPVLPFTGWCTVQAQAYLLEITNYLRLSVAEKKCLNDIMI
jgi:1-acyl-sn-glycerol-3-phosphate acyltransferase